CSSSPAPWTNRPTCRRKRTCCWWWIGSCASGGRRAPDPPGQRRRGDEIRPCGQSHAATGSPINSPSDRALTRPRNVTTGNHAMTENEVVSLALAAIREAGLSDTVTGLESVRLSTAEEVRQILGGDSPDLVDTWFVTVPLKKEEGVLLQHPRSILMTI